MSLLSRRRKPVRTGIFGVVLVACLVLVSFGYSQLPFFPQGKQYDAFFTDAGGITPGNDVNISGIKVGTVGVALAGTAAKVTFTVDRDINVGDQSLVSIKTETVLGQKSLDVAPAGGGERRRSRWGAPPPRTRWPPPCRTSAGTPRAGQAAFRTGASDLTESLHDATPSYEVRSTESPRCRAASTGATRHWVNFWYIAMSDTLGQRAGQVNQLVLDGNLLFAALDERRHALSTLIAGIDDVSRQLSGFVGDNRHEFEPALTNFNLVMDNLMNAASTSAKH